MTKFDLLTRRSVVIGALGAVIAGTLAGAGGAEEGGDTGLIREDWFLASAFDLGADLRLAASRNKRLAVLWEVNGNPLCAETHIKTLGDAAIAAFIHARFEIVQFDAAGVRDITDFDGEKLPEKALAAKYGVRMTPTLQFLRTPPMPSPPSRPASARWRACRATSSRATSWRSAASLPRRPTTPCRCATISRRYRSEKSP